jgi:hypothetical protein
MATPASVTLTTKNTYYKVADGVTSCLINIKAWQPSNYMYTYVVHSASAPTDTTTAIQCHARAINFTSGASADVYMQCTENLGNVIIFT